MAYHGWDQDSGPRNENAKRLPPAEWAQSEKYMGNRGKKAQDNRTLGVLSKKTRGRK